MWRVLPIPFFAVAFGLQAFARRVRAQKRADRPGAHALIGEIQSMAAHRHERNKANRGMITFP